jgi:hypothetical protein
MASCDPNTTILPCWACKDPWELETAMLVFLCRWMNGETGGSCDPQTVMDEGACYACLTPANRWAMAAGMLQEIAGSTGTPSEIIQGCWMCRSTSELLAAAVQLLCDISGG